MQEDLGSVGTPPNFLFAPTLSLTHTMALINDQLLQDLDTYITGALLDSECLAVTVRHFQESVCSSHEPLFEELAPVFYYKWLEQVVDLCLGVDQDLSSSLETLKLRCGDSSLYQSLYSPFENMYINKSVPSTPTPSSFLGNVRWDSTSGLACVDFAPGIACLPKTIQIQFTRETLTQFRDSINDVLQQ